MKELYNLYSVVSNKTVRKHEKFYKRYPRHKFVPGTLVETNRGFFIDGKNVDGKSVENYKNWVEMARLGKITKALC